MLLQPQVLIGPVTAVKGTRAGLTPAFRLVHSHGRPFRHNIAPCIVVQTRERQLFKKSFQRSVPRVHLSATTSGATFDPVVALDAISVAENTHFHRGTHIFAAKIAFELVYYFLHGNFVSHGGGSFSKRIVKRREVLSLGFMSVRIR